MLDYWYFIRPWNPTSASHWQWIPMFGLLSVPNNHEHRVSIACLHSAHLPSYNNRKPIYLRPLRYVWGWAQRSLYRTPCSVMWGRVFWYLHLERICCFHPQSTQTRKTILSSEDGEIMLVNIYTARWQIYQTTRRHIAVIFMFIHS